MKAVMNVADREKVKMKVTGHSGISNRKMSDYMEDVSERRFTIIYSVYIKL